MSPAKKKTTKKSAARKAPAKKAAKKATKKAPARKARAKKAVKKKAAKKAPVKKTVAKKAAAKKATAKKSTAKKATKKAAKAPAKKKAAKKLTKKEAARLAAEEAAKAVKPKKPGNLVVARGKTVSKLGDRWTCWSCEAVFYDLNQPTAVCPKCGQNQSVKPGGEEKKKPAKRDSMRALRVLDDDDGPATPAEPDSGEIEMNLELGTDEKLLDQADKVETEED